MQSKATTVEQYLAELPPDRQPAMEKLHKLIKKNLPKGFEAVMCYGMIGYVVPHKIYPSGYHCDPKLPLPFISIASQKNFIAIYHMGIYADAKLLEWFTKEHAKATPKKMDMGKSCMRYKKPEDIPYELIGQLASKVTPQQWIVTYEKAFRK
jgi:hypothetical protein